MCLQGQSHFIADFFFFFCRKLRKYIGPETPSPDSVEAKEWADLSEKIRLSADDVFTKIQSAFGLKEGVDFVPFFANAVAEFLGRAGEGVSAYGDELRERSPFKTPPAGGGTRTTLE